MSKNLPKNDIQEIYEKNVEFGKHWWKIVIKILIYGWKVF